jgi:hypothetical protein
MIALSEQSASFFSVRCKEVRTRRILGSGARACRQNPRVFLHSSGYQTIALRRGFPFDNLETEIDLVFARRLAL